MPTKALDRPTSPSRSLPCSERRPSVCPVFKFDHERSVVKREPVDLARLPASPTHPRFQTLTYIARPLPPPCPPRPSCPHQCRFCLLGPPPEGPPLLSHPLLSRTTHQPPPGVRAWTRRLGTHLPPNRPSGVARQERRGPANGKMGRGARLRNLTGWLLFVALSAAHGAGDTVTARSDPLEWGRNKLLSVLGSLSPRSRRPSPRRAAPGTIPPTVVLPTEGRASPARAPLPSKAAPRRQDAASPHPSPLAFSAPVSHRPTSPDRGHHAPPRELRLRDKPSSTAQGKRGARDARPAFPAPDDAGVRSEDASLPSRGSGRGADGTVGHRSVSAGAGGGRKQGGIREVRFSQAQQWTPIPDAG